MEVIKILVKDISLFDGKNDLNILARYYLSLVNKTTEKEYPDVFVDVLESENETGSPRISLPANYDGPMNLESLQEILSTSYNYHVNEGSVMDNFLLFDLAEAETQVAFEIDESGIPVEVHYMNVAS